MILKLTTRLFSLLLIFERIKVIKKVKLGMKEDSKAIEQEIDILKNVKCDYVLKYYEYFDQKIDQSLFGFFVTEYCQVIKE